MRWTVLVVALAVVAPACTFDPRALPELSGDSGAIPVDSGLIKLDAGVLPDATPGDVTEPDALATDAAPTDATPEPRCGDGVVDAPGEACDDGAGPDGVSGDGDGCTADCAIEPGWTCSGAPSACSNPPPVAVDDRLRTREETALDLDPLANDRDTAGDLIALVATTTPTLGRLTRAGDRLTYTPRLDAWGRDSFRYTIRDLAGQTASATVTLTVDPVNDAPRTGDLVLRTGFEDDLDVVFDAFDADGHTLRYTTTRPAHGVLGLIDQLNGRVHYTPDRGFVGVDQFTYRASDGSGLQSREASVSIVVLPADWQVPDAQGRRAVCVRALAALPVPVRFPSGALPGAGAGGTDVVFHGPTTGRLPHDVERWAPDDESVLWIRVPGVETATTTCFQAYFARATQGPGPDGTAVWSSEFTSVVHLDARAWDARRGAPVILSGTSTVPGVVGDARFFDGSSRIDLAPGVLDAERGTITAWVRLDPALDVLDHAFLVYGTGAPSGARRGFGPDELHLGLDADERLRFYLGAGEGLVAPERLATGAWRHVAVTWSREDGAILYLDGRDAGRAPHGAARFDTSTLVRLGAPFDPAVRLLVGALDEVRTASVARSPAWIAADRAAILDPATVTLGPLDDGVR